MVYENVKFLADKRGLTIQALEKRAGIPEGTIHRWRDHNNPKIQNLKKVADALGVTVNRLLRE